MMHRKIGALIFTIAILFVGLTIANSQDDNLEDMKRENNGPVLPTVDNIVQASKENMDLIFS